MKFTFSMQYDKFIKNCYKELIKSFPNEKFSLQNTLIKNDYVTIFRKDKNDCVIETIGLNREELFYLYEGKTSERLLPSFFRDKGFSLDWDIF